jgi:hypothetical protein
MPISNLFIVCCILLLILPFKINPQENIPAKFSEYPNTVGQKIPHIYPEVAIRDYQSKYQKAYEGNYSSNNPYPYQHIAKYSLI